MKKMDSNSPAHPVYSATARALISIREEVAAMGICSESEAAEIQAWVCLTQILAHVGHEVGIDETPEQEFLDSLKQKVLDFVEKRLREYKLRGSERN